MVDLGGDREYSFLRKQAAPGCRCNEAGAQNCSQACMPQLKGSTMAKYLQCSECGKLAFYYDDFVGTEKPFYRRFMRYPEGETKHEPPRCFTCGGVPRLIHENIKEEKAAAKH
jgi:hypothetical protein